MKKIGCLIGVVLVIVSGLLFLNTKRHSLTKQVNQFNTNLSSYTLEGKMEILDGEDLRKFSVTTTYLKDGENDLFNVNLEDEGSHQKQQIIRNQDGVFVLAPSLNRAFQFQSEWPFNSFKPYIVQTVFGIFDDSFESEKTKEGYQVTAPISYTADLRVTQLEVILDKNLTLKQVTLYDDNESEIVSLEVTKFELNNDISKEMFDVHISEQTTAVTYDLPFYPLEMMGSELIDQANPTIMNDEKYVLRFAGEGSFTIVESLMAATDEFTIEKLDGDIIEINGAIAIVNDKVVSLLDDGMISQLYSNDLSDEEKLAVITSLKNNIVIEE